MRYLEVAVAAPIVQTLTYSLPDSLFNIEYGEADLCPYIGRRVLVPLGRRRVTGYVLDCSSQKAGNKDFKIRKIFRFLDDFPIFHHELVEFFAWLADYYHFPIGLVIKAALPGGLTPKTGKIIQLVQPPEVLQEYFDKAPPEWITTLAEKGEFSHYQTKTHLKDKEKKKYLADLEQSGIIQQVDKLQGDGVSEKKEVCYFLEKDSFNVTLHDLDRLAKRWSLEPEVIKECQSYLEKSLQLSLRNAEIKALLCLLKLGRETKKSKIALKDLRVLYPGISKPLQSLTSKGVAGQSNERVYRSFLGARLKHYQKPKELTEQQRLVLEKIIPATRKKEYQPILLYGITGSGKTEVYLQAIESTLASARDVIVLVPEIALATQLEAQLVSRFGKKVVTLHSGMSASEKYDQYYLALIGKAQIVIGARSAVFAPLKDPGLIIVDEEHEATYKQDDTFRYNGRDVAIVRAKHHNSTVILGSATPSITSFRNAESGKYTMLSMDKRVGESLLPTVSLVDLNSRKTEKELSCISGKLKEKLLQNLQEDKQSILLLNRRGFSAAMLCRDCGTPVQCEHCNVSLTLHKKRKQLVCHYCGFTQRKDIICFECRSAKLEPVGYGTERVEEELKAIIPDARVERLDSDTAANRKRLISVISSMHQKEIDILIGTQMIAKGHHFPDVTLVGVIWADGGMSMPDYKAAERTFQLITQVTGRAGRENHPGEVVIQTYRPDHYAIQYARQHDFINFYNYEMKVRKKPTFPPFVRLVLLRVKGPVEKHVKTSASSIVRFCRDTVRLKKFRIEVLGPAPSPLDKIKDNFRWQVLLKSSSAKELHDISRSVSLDKKALIQKNCELSIDVDPENMM